MVNYVLGSVITKANCILFRTLGWIKNNVFDATPYGESCLLSPMLTPAR